MRGILRCDDGAKPGAGDLFPDALDRPLVEATVSLGEQHDTSTKQSEERARTA